MKSRAPSPPQPHVFYHLRSVILSLALGGSAFSGLQAEPSSLTVFSGTSSHIGWDVPPAIEKAFAKRLKLSPREDFSRAFSLMTGATIEADTPGKIPFRLELLSPGQANSPLQDLPVGIRENASELEVTPEAITLRAESIHGLSGGLYKILEDWGCRWIMPGALGEVIPSHSSLSLPLGTQIIQLGSDPGMGGGSTLWLQRNRLLRATWTPLYHNWNSGVDPKKYFEDHPEYFALVDGERQPTQVESVNPEVIALKIEDAKAFFRTHPSARSYPMDPEDNTSFSEAPEATKFDPPGTTSRGIPLMTDRVVRFANTVREGFKDEFPEKMVGYYSYLSHSLPPVNVKPDPHTIVGVTRFEQCNLRLVPTPATPTPQEFEDLVQAWLDLTPNVFVYEYQPLPWGAALMLPNYKDLAESMRRLSKMGVIGFYSDAPEGRFAPGVFLNNYIRRRMMVDPTQDPDALMADYCQSFFGPAAKAMEKYYETLSVVTEYDDPAHPSIGVGIFGLEAIYPRDAIAQASADLTAARATPGLSEVQKERLKWVQLGQDYLVNYLAGVDAAKAGDYAKAKKEFDRTLRSLALQERANPEHVKMTDARRRIKASRSVLMATHFPKEEGRFTEWEILGPIPRKAIGRTMEQAMAAGAPLTPQTFDGQTYDWKAYTSPGGLLDLNAAFGRAEDQVVPSKAVAAATVWAPEDMKAQAFFGSFFAFSLFLNGEEIFARPHPTFNAPDSNTATVSLRKGKNTFLIFADQKSRSPRKWTVSLALRNPAGEALNLPRESEDK